jgi:hypothetical protein
MYINTNKQLQFTSDKINIVAYEIIAILGECINSNTKLDYLRIAIAYNQYDNFVELLDQYIEQHSVELIDLYDGKIYQLIDSVNVIINEYYTWNR